MALVKKEKEWSKIFGRRCFTIKMVPPFSKEETMEVTICRPGYQEVMRKVGAHLLCTGFAVLPGVRNMDMRFKLRRTDAVGNEKEVIERSLHELMEQMRYNGYKVWLNVAEIGDGIVAGFFSNVAPGIKTFAENWVRYACAQMWWNLDKRNVDHDTICAVLTNCFEPENLQYVERSRWSRSKGMAVVDTSRVQLDMDAVFENDGTIDFNRGFGC